MDRAIYPFAGSFSLPLMLECIGVCDAKTHISMKNGRQSHLFIIAHSGSGELEANGESIPLKSGSIVYIAPGIGHTLRPTDDEWSAKWFAFCGECADITAKSLKLGGITAKHDAMCDECESIFDSIAEAAADPINGVKNASGLIYGFLVAAADVMLCGGADRQSAANVIGPAARYIEKNYMQEITLERMAALCGVSLQHFCRVFKTAMGMRPMEYLARKRVCAAKAMLDDTDKKIYDIAAAVGYDDQNYFGIIFKKYEGATPTEYRRLRGITANS